MRVLIVEDKPVIALNIRDILIELDYHPVGPTGSITIRARMTRPALR